MGQEYHGGDDTTSVRTPHAETDMNGVTGSETDINFVTGSETDIMLSLVLKRTSMLSLVHQPSTSTIGLPWRFGFIM